MPLIIIGSNYFIGFNENTENDLKNAIDSYEKAGTYCDLVINVKTNKDTKKCIVKNKSIYSQTSEISIIWKILIVILSISLIIGVVLVIKKKVLSRLCH